MGQSQPIPQPCSLTPRIQPTPGSSGRRNRRGTVSIYCEVSCTIYSIKTFPGQTIKDLKEKMQANKCELTLNKVLLHDDLPIESLDLDPSTLIRMQVPSAHSCKSSSTAESLQELDFRKTFGPRQKPQDKIEKPCSDSRISDSEDEDESINLFLKAFAVPDVKLSIFDEKKRRKKA